MKYSFFYSVLFISCICLQSCSSTTSSSNTTSTNTGSVTDITNTLLTNTATDCNEYVGTYASTITDIQNNVTYAGSLAIESTELTCTFTTNSIPNHDVNDATGSFKDTIAAVSDSFTISRIPSKASSSTALSLSLDNAIFLNGVKLDLLPAACYGVNVKPTGTEVLGSEKIGCNDMSSAWRYDPMHTGNNFGTDAHNAHTQPDGTYHYHGNPKALFNDTDSSKASPVIGFAADGFPIYGSYFKDSTGIIRKATSSWRLKTGVRATISGEAAFPGGTYDGTFRDDYEYVDGLGDLDQCNGMTIDGSYGYYVTDSYPWVLGCFSGTPNSSFNKK